MAAKKSARKSTAKATSRAVSAPKIATVPVVNKSTHPIRALSKGDAALVVRLRDICMALPEANERISHGEPTWFAGKGKVFAMLDNHHHGSEHLGVWLPQPRGVQEQMLAADPQRFFRPPYVGPNGWVGVVLDARPDWKGVAKLVRESYVFVATAKLRALLVP